MLVWHPILTEVLPNFKFSPMYLHILQRVPQSNLLVDVLSFENLCQSIIYFLQCLEWGHMGDEAILNKICNYSLSLNHASLMRILSLISLWFWNFFSDKLIQVIFFKDQRDYLLPCLEVISPSKLVLKLSMVSNILEWEPKMEIKNI